MRSEESADRDRSAREPTGGPAGGAPDDAVEGSARGADKVHLMVGVAGGVLLLDQLTKWWIVRSMTLHEIVPVWGDFFRLTYTHNFGAAFGIDVGVYSRVFFLTLALVALGVLAYLFVQTPARRRLRLWALALVTGGAVGNIIDRVRYEAGVVDFLDVGVGSLRWPIFNVADMAVSVGAILLVITFYQDETRPRSSEEPARRDSTRPDEGGGHRREGASDERVVAGEA